MDALRKTYQRAVQIPLNNVEQIWQEYNQFENQMSKMTVSKLERIHVTGPSHASLSTGQTIRLGAFTSLYDCA